MIRHVLITGIGGPAGRSAVTYFRKKGYPVIGTDMQYIEEDVKHFVQVPPAKDSSFPEMLLKLIEIKRPGLIIPTVTEELPVISRLRKVIEGQGCTIFVSPPTTIDITNDKLKTAMVLAGHGLPVPVSFDRKDPGDILIEGLGFPILAKPRYGRGGRDIKIYWTREELLQEDARGLVFQEFIPGEEFNVNLFRNRKGEITASVVLKKILLKEGITGNALSVERVSRADIADTGEKAASVLHMEGPVDIDIRMREDGTPVILEINARIGGNVLCAQEVLDSLLMEWEKEEGLYVSSP